MERLGISQIRYENDALSVLEKSISSATPFATIGSQNQWDTTTARSFRQTARVERRRYMPSTASLNDLTSSAIKKSHRTKNQARQRRLGNSTSLSGILGGGTHFLHTTSRSDFVLDDEMKYSYKNENREYNFKRNEDTAFVEARAKYKNFAA